MKNVYIVDGCRTPIGKTNGILSRYLPEKLGAAVLNALLVRNKIQPKNIDEVILGNAVGPGGNMARLAVLEAGWDQSIPGTTIDFQCGSGMKSILLASCMIKASEADLVVAGGLESTSLEPFRRYHNKDPKFEGEDIFYTRAQFSPKHIGDPDMLAGAENTGELYQISRTDMDRWTLMSHKRAADTREKHKLNEIIISLEENKRMVDEGIREKLSLKLLSKITSLVKENGRITCGNACLTHDGACGILLASKRAIEKYELHPVAKIEAIESVGVDPNYPPIGAIKAVQEILSKNDLLPNEIDAYEVNEAFAVKVLAFIQELGILEDKINRWGGALAYGHPYGASGAVITLHLAEILKQESKERGIAAIGAAGGQGSAILIENTNLRDVKV